VLLERHDDVLEVTLNRPHVHNAYDAATRDALVEAFRLLAADPSLMEAHLLGRGPSFCSGGDLSEFGLVSDPVTGHLVRMARSAGLALSRVGARVTAHIHGACMGAGIEVAAFADRVTASPDVAIALPELTMALVPGAGGTVSLPRRIGRQRSAWMALTGATLDATTALQWGLIDEIVSARAR
jgi:enoyl-CoA hydratase/carnithine racemase